MYSVRMATIADADGIAELFNQYRMFYEQESDIEGAKQFLLQRFQHFESIIFVAINDSTNTFVGFTQLYPSFSSISMKRSFILNDLYVEEDHRKQGVAQLLLDAVKEFAILSQAKGISLETSIHNSKAQRLYERNGFVNEKEFYSYYLTLSKF